jgi:hypothetical protein
MIAFALMHQKIISPAARHGADYMNAHSAMQYRPSKHPRRGQRGQTPGLEMRTACCALLHRRARWPSAVGVAATA